MNQQGTSTDAVADAIATARDFQALRAVVYALSGVVIWDFFSTIRYDYQILRGTVPRSWPALVFVLTRVSSLFLVGGLIPQMGSTSRVNCEAVWVVILLGTTMQKCFGQAMFMIRTCAIWSWNAYVCTGLGMLWLVHWVISLVNLHTDHLEWTPEPTIPGYGYCIVDRWSKYIGIAYLSTFVMDIIMIALSAYRLAKMGKAVRSSFWTILFNDGISWCFLTICPTLTAIICFYLGKTIPTQSAALLVASTLHALLACRAYRKLSDFADTLPLSFCARDKVRNGTMLDADTLARLAWISGNPEGDVPLNEHVGGHHQGDRLSGPGGSPGAIDKERPSMAPSSSPALEHSAHHKGMGSGGDSVSLDYGTGSAYYFQDAGSDRGVYLRSQEGSDRGLGMGFSGAATPSSLVRSQSARKDSTQSAQNRGRPAIAGIQITTQRSYQEEEIDERARELDLAPHPHSNAMNGGGQFEGLRAAAAAAAAAAASARDAAQDAEEDAEDVDGPERTSSSPSDAPQAPLYHAAVLPPSALSPSAAARRAQRGGGSAGSGR